MSDTPTQDEKHFTTVNEGTGEKTNPPTPPIPLEMQTPNKMPSDHDANHDKGYRLQWWNFFVQVGLFFVTLGAFIAAAIYAYIAYKQWDTMNATFKEVEKQTAATIKSSNAAADGVKVAKDTLEANQKGMETNLNQSKSALQASIEIARRDQRAWVGVIEVMPAILRDADNNPYI